jgi:hypothetical protein
MLSAPIMQYSTTVEKQIDDVHISAYNEWTSQTSLVDMKLTVTFSSSTTPESARATATNSLGELRKEIQWPAAAFYRQQGGIRWQTDDRVVRGTACFMLP